MFKSRRPRALILGGMLLATITASVWPTPPNTAVPPVVAPVTQRDAQQHEQVYPAAPTTPPTLVNRHEETQTSREVRDLFAAMSWAPPAPRVRSAAPPAPPMPPPFPYSVAGSITDTNGLEVVFTNHEQNFFVPVGALLEQRYRVDAIDGDSATLTYLPLGLTQRVPIGEVN
jgi:hypothetical protein